MSQTGDPHFTDVRVPDLMQATVAIVGLGLMGGSLAGALRGACRAVVGVTRREAPLDFALEHGWIDHGTTDLAQGVAEADIVVLATPVRIILQQIPEISPFLPEGCLLMDMGSTKDEVVAVMERLPAHIQVLGGHPMCGKETSGIEVADPALYRQRTFILSPLPRTSARALALGRSLALAVGANPLVIEAARQDHLVAAVSHLPYLLACALVRTVDTKTSADPLAWEIFAGGFRDTSRVAGSDVTMMLDILMTNQEQVVAATEECLGHLNALKKLVSEGNEDALRVKLGAIRDRRREMFP